MAKSRVTSDWTVTYPDPIRVAKHDPLTLSGRTDNWEGNLWLWATAPTGNSGWVPDTLELNGRAVQDYSALELTVTAGETVETFQSTHGWTWCRAENGNEGWVPDRCLGQPNDG